MKASRLAFSTNAFKKNTLEEAIDAIADAGYAGVELMADVPHAYPPSFDEAHRQRVREQIARRGMTVSNVNAFTLFAQGDTYHPTWIESAPKLRQNRVDHTVTCIELAAQFGAKTVSLQPGGPLIGTGQTAEDASLRFAGGIERVLPAAQQHQVILAIEPEPGLLIESSAEYRAFKAEHYPNHPLVRMNCDIGHLFCVGEDPAAVIRAMPQEIVHVHLEDIGK